MWFREGLWEIPKVPPHYRLCSWCLGSGVQGIWRVRDEDKGKRDMTSELCTYESFRTAEISATDITLAGRTFSLMRVSAVVHDSGAQTNVATIGGPSTRGTSPCLRVPTIWHH